VAFHHVNPETDATAGECDTNAGVVTWHITMVCSMGRVSLKGLTNPDKRDALQRYNNVVPDVLEIEVNKLVWEIMLCECKADGVPCDAQLQEGMVGVLLLLEGDWQQLPQEVCGNMVRKPTGTSLLLPPSSWHRQRIHQQADLTEL
jgi:hypothetical protein